MTPLSARSIAAEIEAGRLSPQAALDQCQRAIAEHEEEIRVFSCLAKDWQPGSGPLSGVAIGVKDIFDTYDLPTSYGSPIYEGHQPVVDSALVTMLRQAGATIAGKTVTTEFAWFEPGPTRNPHNLEYSPGGSSSGSAAGVAAGFFPAAVGTQTGGSIVRPAAFCGVAGYKPSYRLFPSIGMKHFSQLLDTIGFFAAQVADAAFVAAACSGRDLSVDERNTAPPRIGVYRSSIDHLMEGEMVDALEVLAKQAEESGAVVAEVSPVPEVEAARQAHAPIQDFEAAATLADERRRHPLQLSDRLRDHLNAAARITPQTYDDARRIANRGRKASRDLFENCDVLLTASAPGVAPKTLASTGDSSFNRLWTLLGLPCVNVPGLTANNGLPLGAQIIAPFGQDKQALQAAHWLETVIRQKRLD